jgi:hypothetical protein
MSKSNKEKGQEAHRKLKFAEAEADGAKKIFEDIGDSDGAGFAKKASDAAKEGADYIERKVGKNS